MATFCVLQAEARLNHSRSASAVQKRRLGAGVVSAIGTGWTLFNQGRDGSTTHRIINKIWRDEDDEVGAYPHFVKQRGWLPDHDEVEGSYSYGGNTYNSGGYIANPSQSAKDAARAAGALTNREASRFGYSSNIRDEDDEVGGQSISVTYTNSWDQDDEAKTCSVSNYARQITAAKKRGFKPPSAACTRAVFNKLCSECKEDTECYLRGGEEVARQTPQCMSNRRRLGWKTGPRHPNAGPRGMPGLRVMNWDEDDNEGTNNCVYNGMDFSALKGTSYKKHETIMGVSTDWHLTICGSNALHCNEPQFNWPPRDEWDRKHFPVGSLVQVYNWAKDNGKYKSCNVLGQYQEEFSSWDTTEKGNSELILRGGGSSTCNVRNPVFAKTHIEFVCAKTRQPHPSEIKILPSRNCVYKVVFPTSLACARVEDNEIGYVNHPGERGPNGYWIPHSGRL